MSTSCYGQTEKRLLIVFCPELLNTKIYKHELKISYTDESFYWGSPSGCRSNIVEDNGQTFECEIKSDNKGVFEDSIVQIVFEIAKWSRHGVYKHLETKININSDTVYYHIAPIQDESLIEEYLKEEKRNYKKKHRNERFLNFITTWDSRVLHLTYHQGHYPYGEISFGSARYNTVKRFVFKGDNISGAIWGPTIGSEFNFKWQNGDLILGPKIGYNESGLFFNYGAHLIYYTDFNQGSMYISPHFGINPKFPFVNISYAYSIRIGPNIFGNQINTHQLNLNIIIPLKLKEYDYSSP